MPDDDQSLREALLNTMQILHRRGWCDGTGGNFSVVRQRLPLQLLMAPSGVDKGSVQPGQLIAIDGQGCVVEGEGRASAETAVHIAIVDRLKAGCVLHTHSLAATVLSRCYCDAGSIPLEGWEMLKGIKGVSTHDTTISLGVVANNQNMQDLVQSLETHLREPTCGVLVAGHGLYAWGETIEEAKRHVEIFEFLLSAHWMYQQMSAALKPAA